MKVLYFDIETAPNLGYTWAKYEQTVLDYVEEWSMLCFCWKWDGQSTIHSASVRDYDTEEGLVRKMWELFEEADIIIAHNGDQFDIKMSNAKFLGYGLPPPSGYVTVDTKKVAKKYFRFNSNSLNDLGKTLELGTKVQTGGFELWLGCMRNEAPAWKLMIQYCKQDVALLEKVYKKLRPWMTNHPNYNVLNGTTHQCPVCGGDTMKRGYSITRVGKRQRYQCKEHGCWSLGEIIRTDVVTR